MRLSHLGTPPAVEAGSDVRLLAAGGSLNLLGGSISALANVGCLVVVTRGLDKTSAGEYFAVTSGFLMAVSVSKLGSATGLVYFIAQFRALGVWAGARRSIRLGVLPVAVAGTTIGALAFAVAPQLAALIGGAFQPRGVSYLRQVALLLPFAAVGEALQAATRGVGDMRTTVVVDRVLRSGLQLILLFAACAVGGRYAALAWVLPYVPATLLCAWFLRRLWRQAAAPDLDGSPSAQPKGSRYWRFTAPRAAADILQVALHRLDVVLVAALLGPAQAAVYAAATRFINLVGLSNQALSNVLEPQASALFARRDSLGVMGRYQLTTGWLVALSWPVCLVAMIFPTVILAPFGAGYGVGASVVVPLAASMLFSSACGLVDLVLGMSGRTGWNLANMTVALTLNISLDLLLIPELGIRGAALGWAAAVVVGNLLPILEIRWLLGIHPFGRGTFLAVGLAIGCYGPLPLAARVVWGDRPIALLISVPIATACYLPALLAWAARWRVPRGKDAND